MAKSKIVTATDKIGETVSGGYKKIEESTVHTYEKIEEGAVNTYKKLSKAPSEDLPNCRMVLWISF